MKIRNYLNSGMLRDSIKTSGMTLTQLLSGAVIGIFWARLLGPAELGSYTFFINICAVCALLINPSLYSASNYFMSSKRWEPKDIWVTLLIYSLLLGVFGFILAYISYLLLFKSVEVIPPLAILFLFISIVSSIIYANFSGILYGSRKVTIVTSWNIISSVLNLLGTLFIVVTISGQGDNNLSWHYPFIWYSFVQMLNAFMFLVFSFPKKPVLIFDVNIASEITKYGIAVYPGRIATFLNYRIDTFLITAILGSSYLGIYSIATTLAELVWQIPNSVSLIMLPRLVSLDKEEAINRSVQVSHYVLLLAFLVACSLGSLSYWIIHLIYGLDFAGAQLPLLVLLPGVVIFSTVKITEPFFQSLKKPHLPSLAAFIGLFLNITANYLLIPRVGIIGSALASVISYSVQAILLSVFWQTESKKQWWTLFIPSLNIGKYPSR